MIKPSIKTGLFKTAQIRKWRIDLLHANRLMKIGGAAAVGTSVGVLAAALTVHRPSTVYAASAPAPYILPINTTSPAFSLSQEQAHLAVPAGDSELIERLKTRNRRLEALVTVLRQRAAERR